MSFIQNLYNRLVRNPSWFWSTDAGLTWLLVTLILYLFVVSPLSKHYDTGEFLRVLSSFVLFSAVVSASPSTRLRLLMLLVLVPTGVLQWVAGYSSLPIVHAMRHFSLAIFCGMIAVVLLTRAFERGPKTGHRVRGAIAVYLILGVMWAALYQLVDVVMPGAFRLADSPNGTPLSPALRDNSFIYFSFVTLTTVGYGDMVAIDPLARSLTQIEALVGQLFPAVLLARLVALQVSEPGLAERGREPREDIENHTE
jgi:voltage-gated potassium channel Kch